MLLRITAIVGVMSLSACGGDEEARSNAATEAPAVIEADLAADAALANEAAAAEAADAAIGGTLNATDVAAANEQAAR